MVVRACLLALALSVTPVAAAQQPARDAARPAVGTGSISGTVVLDDAEHRPVRRARVTLTCTELQIGQTAITEDDGTFAFRGLPAGRYMLAPFKESYVSIAYGATRPSRPGAALVLPNGEARRVTLQLAKGSVLAGAILNIDGTPASGVSIRAMRYAFLTGERQLIPAGNQAVTDDRGMYRIYGLTAGDYAISSSSRSGILALGDIHPMTASDMRAALDELGATGPSRQSRPGGTGAAEAVPGGESPRMFGYTAVYYPGTTFVSEAGVIAVAQGVERGGIDFQLQFVPMARLSGTVSNADGTPPPAMTTVTLIANAPTAAMMDSLRLTRTGADGKFTLTGIAPGRYVVTSRASPRPAASPSSVSGMPDVGAFWASAEITVEGTDVPDVALTLQRGFTISGRLAFDGTAAVPSDLTRARVTLQPVQSAGEVNLAVTPAQVDAQGQFAINGVTPGRYRLTATLPAGRPDAPVWRLKSSVMDERDTLDVPFEVRQSVANAVITFTDRTTEIGGLVRDASGEPSPACFVVIASADRTQWTPQSRRIMSVRPTSDGKYTIRNLPPGEYLIAAVSDVEQGEWFDPAFLQRFALLAAKMTLGEGEHKSQDLGVR